MQSKAASVDCLVSVAQAQAPVLTASMHADSNPGLQARFSSIQPDHLPPCRPAAHTSTARTTTVACTKHQAQPVNP